MLCLENLRRSADWIRWVGYVSLLSTGLTGCYLGGESCVPEDGEESWCSGNTRISCAEDGGDGYVIRKHDCRDEGGVCREGECVLRHVDCGDDQQSICVDDAVYRCSENRALSLSPDRCSSQGLQCFEESSGDQRVAFCAVSPLQACPPSADFCEGSVLAKCNSYGFVEEKTDCMALTAECLQNGDVAGCVSPKCDAELSPSSSSCDGAELVWCRYGVREDLSCGSDASCVEVAGRAWCSSQPDPSAVRWVPVAGGSFEYWPGYDNPDESVAPQSVVLDDFEILATEVTHAQFLLCEGVGQCQGGYILPPGVPYPRVDFPVTVEVSDALAFCAFLDADLPTDIEWQYLARNFGGPDPYPWGNEAPDCSRAILAEDIEQLGCGAGGPQVPCSRPTDVVSDGVCDVVGNVQEYTHWPQPEGTFVTSGYDYRTTQSDIPTPLRRPFFSIGPGVGFRCVKRN